MNKTKILGQTFTETSEVLKMINLYKNKEWINSKILEPSFGSGHFLEKIILKMYESGVENNLTKEEIENRISNNLHGYEIDEIFYKQAIKNIREWCDKLGLKKNMEFPFLKNETAFDIKNEYKYDLIIGNPPYVRVQNFGEGIKQVRHSLTRTDGNTDLYLMFIDFFIKNMSDNGQFIFVIPNSFGKSMAARKIRDFMYENGAIDYFDFEDRQLFPNVSVYSCVINFKINSTDTSYFYVPNKKNNWFYNKKILVNKNFFGPNVRKIISEDLGVKNGIATLADSIFIHSNKLPMESVYPIYKASRLDEKKYIIFPYKIQGKDVIRFKSESEFKKTYPKMFKYLSSFKKDLISRSLEKNTHWFEYGRSQAIKDIVKEKIIIDTLIKPGQEELKIKKIKSNTLVYSGLYTTTSTILKYNNSKLIKSLRFQAKDMRGGYKKISSSLLKHVK